MTDTGEMSGYEELFAPLEAILMVAPEPVDVGDLAEALHVNPQTVHDALCALSASYRGENGQRTAGFELRQTGEHGESTREALGQPRWALHCGQCAVSSVTGSTGNFSRRCLSPANLKVAYLAH